MSRFDGTRRGRIAIWTGAALAWGTAVTMGYARNAQAAPEDSPTTTSPAVEVDSPAQAAVPAQPADGLMIIRFQPAPDEKPPVRTVYVQQAAPKVAAAPAPAAQAAPAAPAPKAAAPAPKSSGS